MSDLTTSIIGYSSGFDRHYTGTWLLYWDMVVILVHGCYTGTDVSQHILLALNGKYTHCWIARSRSGVVCPFLKKEAT